MQTAQVIQFQFDAREVRTMLIDDQPWFVATDVAASLGYPAAPQMTRNLDEDEKGMQNVHTPGGDQEMLVINESGLYSAILRSRKAEAKRFKKWVTAEVLPAIRKHGRYEDSSNKMATLVGETIGTDGFHMLGSLIKGKVAALPVEVRRRAAMKIWSQTHAAFGLGLPQTFLPISWMRPATSSPPTAFTKANGCRSLKNAAAPCSTTTNSTTYTSSATTSSTCSKSSSATASTASLGSTAPARA
ncbi:hypothetical protein PAEP54_00160 [Pseudomonas phage YMC11/07/P54_PAE_BP]|uniref:anti-repressor Ant n=1 Tax=Pseudomonas phage YMC11/07/P54_PAE_BP TaxID=1777064 RepID=UPI00078E29AB|nr:anti-repressor Ant [Pseudomonas phage YMC11/07/P54_PAE_BP]AMO43567.1 hypothetical protein PAEP54_00160 [Pseudomonas phage YMC11/07/P54_PAE_BP]